LAAPTDVLVVGAGPAGSIAALTLARAGARVRVIDRARFPRDKLCGDTVNPGSLAVLDRAGLGADIRARGIPVHGMMVTGPNGARVVADYPPGIAGVALTRRVLDQVLIDAAIAGGAQFDDGVGVLRPVVADDGAVTGVTVRSGGAEYDLRARVVIAADGRASRLGSLLGLSAFGRQPRRWAFGAYYEGVGSLSARGEMHVRAGEYIGVAPLANGVANVCVVRELQRESGVDTLERALAADLLLRGRFAHARRVSEVTVLGPLAVEAHAAGRSGLLLAGDAAGFVDPMTGDGLRFALRGGVLAAEHALHEMETGVAQHALLATARRREFAGKWRVNRALRTLVGSPAGVVCAARLAAWWDLPVRSLVALAGDVALAREATGRA
jgi:geranylgeranyl reductase family protein